jgi:flagellar basal-body rod modification protein FlgD
MSSIAGALSSQTTGATNNTTTNQSNPVTDPLANESTFLTLLVSQLQNQDPLSPTDSNQFVSQLTAYSQLEQLIGIHGNTTTLATAAAPDTTGGTPTTTGTGV